ncbi:MAG: hypothetical protein A2X64_07930 [Ignavibacteria bacterium GWF2_33_9]|nr:MAG: hypothetical protein A2X64_07930 [Ignavibacteria bacterium GWF2_33_9]
MSKYYILIIFFVLSSFISPELIARGKSSHSENKIIISSKPYTRYWWFASMIKEEDVRFNLDWLKANGFGGVEVAWVYPLNRFNPKDTTYTPRQEWLSPEWTRIVEYTLSYAKSIDLGCDLTFGTLWPFGDTYVTFDQATQKYGEPKWRQEITRSWQHPKPGYVIDHLSPSNYKPYFERLIDAFPRIRTKLSPSYFIDSWEVETEKLWCDGFAEDFQTKYSYDITKYMDSIYAPRNSKYLYDYMCLISDKVIRFYKDYTKALNKKGIYSRGQVSGAPCDLISGYALMDIPEGESMLFEPEFCSIPASSALLTRKKYVSSETFTCLYGWPRDYIREEQTADLKLVADALFANGINHIIWHGKAHNPAGQDTVNFYATTHIGSSSNMAKEVSNFNRYLGKVASHMRRGKTYSDIAVYLPTEDAWTAGVMPKDKQFIWAWGYYEMRYVYFPDELAGYSPTWINGEFLDKAKVTLGVMQIGDASYKALYVNSEYLDYKVLKRLNDLARKGLQIILKKDPKQPGAVSRKDYADLVVKLKKSKHVISDLPEDIAPFITGDIIPNHWCRKEGKTLYAFFPNPKSNRLKFPMEYGQSLETETKTRKINIKYEGKDYDLTLEFKPYQSLLYKIENGKIEQIDITFVPETPIVKKRPADYVAPWLVK